MTVDVVVVGSVNVDLVVRVLRLPAKGETVTGGTFVRAPGGKGANQAAAAARLGARTRFVGLVGPDELGAEARRALDDDGVDVSTLGTGSRHTGVAGILVDDRGDNLIAVASGANAEVSAAYVDGALAGIDVSSPVVLANLEIPLEAATAAARWAAARGGTFVLNPAPARSLDPSLLARCSVVVANEHEAAALGGASMDDLLAAGAGALVVTRGRQGADLHRPGRPTHRQLGFPVDAVDTTGAGDAFCGALAWALGDGRGLEDGVRLAAAAGALACRQVGARGSLPTAREVLALVADA
ncbi:MAG TPA: ribokinase [Actinomycetota bacterium]|nr:ribokinase [Actinomycetota bacterium]